MRMLIDYAKFKLEDYGKEKKMDLVKLIALNIKESKNPISEEQETNDQDSDSDSFDVWWLFKIDKTIFENRLT